MNRGIENKILFLASDFNIGLSFTLADQAKSLFNIFGKNLICLSGEKEQVKDLSLEYLKNNIDLRIIKGLDKHRNFLNLCEQIHRLIKKEKITIVHTHNNWQIALFACIKYFKKNNVRIIYTIHGYRHNNWVKAFFARHIIGFGLYMFADVVLAGSTQLKQAVPFISKKCFLLFQGVNSQIAEISREKDFCGVLQITVVGQFRVGKNQKLILEALDEYSRITKDLDFVLNFAGIGPLMTNIKSYVKELSISNNVVFHGQLNREEIIKLYEKTDISIIATNNETFGFCIAEPIVSEIPTFSRNTGIARDIIRHGENGFVFENDGDLIGLLLNYLRNEELLKQISETLKKEKNRLLWDTINSNYLKILNEN